MRIIRYFLIFFLAFCLLKASGQTSIKISGVVKQLYSNELINSVSIQYLEKSAIVNSNDFGFFSIKANNEDSCTLIFSHLSHEQKIIKFLAEKDTFLIVYLSPATKTLDDIKIISTPLFKTQTASSISIPIEKLEKIPSFLGEKDILKVIQLLPGVQSGNEGSSGLYVRGGGADQNMILLDGVPIYNISHLFGFFSLFPAESVKSVELIKGGFPARFGGRLSSVLDIKLKEGNQGKYTGSISTGLLSSRVSFEGPIKKDRSSFIITARRTYFDALAKLFTTNLSTGGGYYFYDGLAKFNFSINNKNRVFLSAYTGKDFFFSVLKDGYKSGNKTVSNINETGFGWGNHTLSFRWNQILSNKLHLNYTSYLTKYNYNLDFKGKQTNESTNETNLDFIFNYYSSIKDLCFKTDADWYVSNKTKIKYGLNVVQHNFIPSASSSKRTENGITNYSEQTSKVLRPKEIMLFTEADMQLLPLLKLNIGFHHSIYNINKKNFTSLQPRISGIYRVNKTSNIKFGYSTMLQPIHLLTNNGPGLPTDLWVPATINAPPQKSKQYSLGYVTDLHSNYEVTVESYYKAMNGLIEYQEGANFLNTALNWEDKIEKGKGKSYGTELFLQKKTGKFSGWIGYTLSWSKREFPNLNSGLPFFYKFDRRHDFKTVTIYSLQKNINISLNFLLNSGNRITIPNIFYNGYNNAFPYSFPDFLFTVNNTNTIYYSTGRNNQKMKTYHRTDLSIDFSKEKRYGNRVWSISIYNVYSRQNPYMYYYKQNPGGGLTLTQVSIFPIVPSVTYSFKWN